MSPNDFEPGLGLTYIPMGVHFFKVHPNHFSFSSNVKGDMTQKMPISFLCPILTENLFNEHTFHSYSNNTVLIRYACFKPQRSETVGVTSDLRNDSRESEHRAAKCFNKRDACKVKRSSL